MRTSALVLAIAVALVAGPVAASDVAGTWKVDGDVVGNPVRPTVTLTQTGDTLEGTAAMPGVADVPVRGTAKDRAVRFTFDVTHEGSVYTLTFAGTVGEDGVMKGGIDVEGMAEGQFTATRQ